MKINYWTIFIIILLLGCTDNSLCGSMDDYQCLLEKCSKWSINYNWHNGTEFNKIVNTRDEVSLICDTEQYFIGVCTIDGWDYHLDCVEVKE